MASSIPVVLTIAGSDSGGGAGIQADLRAIGGCGCFGTTAITAVTAQNPHEVSGVWTIPAVGVAAQIAAVAGGFPIAAVKTGMLANAEIVRQVAVLLEALRAPVVVDPVMIATSGGKLLEDDAVETLRRELLPIATVVTPNVPEAEALLGRPLTDDLASAAAALASQLGVAVLLKGGHALAGNCAVDYLATPDGHVERLEAPIVQAATTHGTGCTLAAALAANLALGLPLPMAARNAKTYVTNALNSCIQVSPKTAALGPPPQINRLI